MKKVAIGILVLGLTSLGLAQQAAEPFMTASLEDHAIAPANSVYLESAWDANTPLVVQSLQRKAAAFDVTTNSEFDKNLDEPFEVVFKSNKGSLIAYYNNVGEITMARENFKNVALPEEIREKVLEFGEDWTIQRTRFQSFYQDDKVVKRSYRIGLQKGKKRKIVTIAL